MSSDPTDPPEPSATVDGADPAAREQQRLAEVEELVKSLEAEARSKLAVAEQRVREVAERERKVNELEKATERHTQKLDADRAEADERERKLDQREQKVVQRAKELDGAEARRKELEREAKKREGELAERERKVKERELEADAGFERRNAAALAALEQEHRTLRGQLAAVRQEIQTERERGFAQLDSDLARERARRMAAIEQESADARARDEQQLKEVVAGEERRLREHIALQERALQADHQRREQALTVREAAEAERARASRTSDDVRKAAIAAEHERATAALRDRELDLDVKAHELRVGRATLESDQARVAEAVEQKVRDRASELETRLATAKQQAEERLDQVVALEKRLAAFDELRRRFQGQEPEDIIKERDFLRIRVDDLKDELDRRPSAEDKQRLEQLGGERDRLTDDLADARRERDALKSERNRWLLSVSQLEEQRSLREAEERRRGAIEAQCERLSQEVDRVKRLYEAPQDRAKRIESIESPWDTTLVRDQSQPPTELEWLEGIVNGCKDSGLEFSRRLLLAFHTALKASDWSPLAVLAGVSGTGKSELPRLYARFGGLAFMPRPVQPNWDSPQSLFGYYNSLDNRFDATPLLKALAQSQQDPTQPTTPHGFEDRLLLVLLDELNLAHIEQYFSDLLSRLEQRRGVADVDLDIELGSGEKYPLRLGRNVLWVGTMNEDETTKSLSDKVIDRSNLIYFPRPQTLLRRQEPKLAPERPLLSRWTWEGWIVRTSPFSDDEVAHYKLIVEKINEHLERVGRALGHRVWQAMEHYMANHPDVIATRGKDKDPDAAAAAMRRAFADQLVQKAMPKLRGIPTAGHARTGCLDPIARVLATEKLGLDDDFASAMRVGDGAFVWSSARYLEADR